MNIDQDFEEIKKKLTGDKKKDIQILFSAIDEYADRPYAAELIKKVGDCLNDIIKDNGKDTTDFLNAFIQKQASKNYDAKLNEVKKLIDEGKYEEALAKTYPLENDIAAAIKMGKDAYPNQNIVFRFCFSAMEYDLSDKYFYDECATLLPVDAVSLYTLRGQALFFLKRDDEAIETIRKGFEFDPVSVDLCFLLADIEKERMRYISYFSYIDRAKDYIYKEADLFRYLSYLAFYYQNALDDKETSDEIKLLMKNAKNYKQMIHPAFKNQDIQKKQLSILQDLKNKKIDIHVSSGVINTAIESYINCQNNNDVEGMNYFKSVVFAFLTPNEFNKLLNESNS